MKDNLLESLLLNKKVGAGLKIKQLQSIDQKVV